KVLEPLRKELDGAERWILSPDGALWLVPWSALPLNDQTVAVEKHPIQLVVSGRDLLLSALKLDRKPSAPLGGADPGFGLGRREASQLAKGAVRRSATGEEATRAASGQLRLGHVKRLPYTAAEAQAITPKLEEWTATSSRLFTGKRALEGVVKA